MFSWLKNTITKCFFVLLGRCFPRKYTSVGRFVTTCIGRLLSPPKTDQIAIYTQYKGPERLLMLNILFLQFLWWIALVAGKERRNFCTALFSFVPLPYGPSLKIAPHKKKNSDLTWVPWVSWVYRCWDRTNLSSVLNLVEVNWFFDENYDLYICGMLFAHFTSKLNVCTFVVDVFFYILLQICTFEGEMFAQMWCLHIWLRAKCLHKCGCLHICGRNVCTNVVACTFVGEMFAQNVVVCTFVVFCTFHSSTGP